MTPEYILHGADGTTKVVKYRRSDGPVSKRISLARKVAWLHRRIQNSPVVSPELLNRLVAAKHALNDFDKAISSRPDRFGPTPRRQGQNQPQSSPPDQQPLTDNASVRRSLLAQVGTPREQHGRFFMQRDSSEKSTRAIAGQSGSTPAGTVQRMS